MNVLLLLVTGVTSIVSSDIQHSNQYKRSTMLHFLGKGFSIDYTVDSDMYGNGTKENALLCVHGSNGYANMAKCDVQYLSC